MTQRRIDLTLSALATVAAFFLSWPFWRDFEYWAESRDAWPVHFILGFLLAFYVFYVFIGCVRTLFLHDAIVKVDPEKAGIVKPETEEKP